MNRDRWIQSPECWPLHHRTNWLTTTPHFCRTGCALMSGAICATLSNSWPHPKHQGIKHLSAQGPKTCVCCAGLLVHRDICSPEPFKGQAPLRSTPSRSACQPSPSPDLCCARLLHAWVLSGSEDFQGSGSVLVPDIHSRSCGLSDMIFVVPLVPFCSHGPRLHGIKMHLHGGDVAESFQFK